MYLVLLYLLRLWPYYFVKEPKLHAVGTFDGAAQPTQPTKSTSLREDFKAVQQQPVLVRLLGISSSCNVSS